jgi:nucleotide-binding universal stress UspA family protein
MDTKPPSTSRLRFSKEAYPEPFHRVLVPIDFSVTSEGAIDMAMKMAARYGITLVLLHVYQIPTYTFPDGLYIAPAEQAAQLSDAAQRGLNKIADRFSSKGFEVEAVLAEGNIAETIIQQALVLNTDLILLGTHGRTGIIRAFLGSVAESVVRSSTIPVMIIRSDDGNS